MGKGRVRVPLLLELSRSCGGPDEGPEAAERQDRQYPQLDGGIAICSQARRCVQVTRIIRVARKSRVLIDMHRSKEVVRSSGKL